MQKIDSPSLPVKQASWCIHGYKTPKVYAASYTPQIMHRTKIGNIYFK